MAKNDTGFETFYQQHILPQVAELCDLRNREEIVHEEDKALKSISDPYIHKLVTLMNNHLNKGGQCVGHKEVDFKQYYHSLLVPYFEQLFFGDCIASSHENCFFNLAYAMVADTSYISIQPGNFYAYKMFYQIRFPKKFSGHFITYHKDLLLDIAQHRDHGDLKRIHTSDEFNKHYKTYGNDEAEAKKLLTDDVYQVITDLSKLNHNKPLDLAVDGDSLLIICHHVQQPFNIDLKKKGDDKLLIADDFQILNTHVNLIKRLVELCVE